MHAEDHNDFYSQLIGLFILLTDCDRLIFERYDLTVQRYFLLHHLAEEPGATFTRLSEKTFADKASISRMIRSMEKEGLVERRTSEVDRRAVHLNLTDKGAAIYEDVHEAHQTDLAERFAHADNLDGNFFASIKHLQGGLQSHLAELYAVRE